jgi:hypothetical protein
MDEGGRNNVRVARIGARMGYHREGGRGVGDGLGLVKVE